MLPAVMTRPFLRTFLFSLVVVAAVAVAGCGSDVSDKPGTHAITVSKKDPLYPGADTFNQRCGGCHTFDSAGTEGSAVKPNNREYKDGPNFNVRKEQYQDVLYAIRNGGFSSGPMPQNIVTGRQAQIVACFVATYSGRKAARLPTPGKKPVAGAGTDNCKQQFASK
jgi:mono/diheme cytochrome c family protein